MAEAAGSAEPTTDARTVDEEVSVQRLNQASHQAAGRKLLAITPRRFGRNATAHSSPRRPRSDNAGADNERPQPRTHAHANVRVYGVALRRFPKPPSSPRARCRRRERQWGRCVTSAGACRHGQTPVGLHTCPTAAPCRRRFISIYSILPRLHVVYREPRIHNYRFNRHHRIVGVVVERVHVSKLYRI